jgi:hypothetical protein
VALDFVDQALDLVVDRLLCLVAEFGRAGHLPAGEDLIVATRSAPCPA